MSDCDKVVAATSTGKFVLSSKKISFSSFGNWLVVSFGMNGYECQHTK